MSRSKEKLKSIRWSNMGILLALILMFIYFSFASDNFLSAKNMANIARQISIVGICAVGMTMIILTGGIDLSVGSLIGLASVMSAMLLSKGLPISVSVLLTLLAGVGIGFLNGLCINLLKIPPMIATLGMMISLRGAVYVISGGMPIYGIPEGFKLLGQGSVAGFPLSFLIMAVVFVIGYILLEKSVFGREIYGIGGNRETARLSGVNVERVLWKMYCIAGLFAALAGLIMMSRVNSGQPSAGDGYEMDVITAVVLGGVSVNGGEGKIAKVIVGVVFMGILANGMMMLNINEYWQRVVKGIVLLVAVAIDIKSREAKK